MNRVVSLQELIALIEPRYHIGKTGRPPFPVATMQRIHFMKQLYGRLPFAKGQLLVVDDGGQLLPNFQRRLGNDETVFNQKASYLIDLGDTVPHEQAANSMHGLDILPLNTVHST